MAVAVIMPRQGQSVESCIITKWHKKKGDKVEVGDILFSYETDKASFDEEAREGGLMLEIYFDEGDDVPCLTNVCVIGNEGENTAEFNPEGIEGKTDPDAAEAAAPDTTNAEVQIPLTGESGSPGGQTGPEPQFAGGQPAISPRARKLAEKTGVDIRYATASGPHGRIIERDIAAITEAGVIFTKAALDMQGESGSPGTISGTGLGGRITTKDLDAAATAAEKQKDRTFIDVTGVSTGRAGVTDRVVSDPYTAAGTESAAEKVAVSGESLYEEVRLPNIRKVIAKAMHQSLSTMAQLTLNTSFDATDILELRKKLKLSKDKLGIENITINDLIIYAVSRVLQRHKALNAHFLEDRMLYFRNVNMGVAVDTERGLMVPTLINANLKSLNEISAEAKQLARDCQSGTINPDLLKGGSFTVTNLGTLDVESFTPVINPPQTGILGVNNIVQKVKEADGEYKFYPAMGLSLTFDHRAVDGAPAARFLKDLKNTLEDFSVLMLI